MKVRGHVEMQRYTTEDLLDWMVLSERENAEAQHI